MEFRTATSSNDLPRMAREDARALVDRFLHRSSDKPFCAQQILEECPELREFSSCVLDLAYEEFCRIREAGKSVAATEFARRFPDVQQSLYRVIEFDQILHQHPSLIDEVPEDRWPVAGDVFGEFQLLEQIGRGALSRVFLARQLCLGQRHVVAKVCVRGEREASLLGQLDHPGIAPVHSIHSDPETGLSTICMPWLTRATLHQLTESLASSRRQTISREQLTVRDLKALVEELNQPSAVPAVDVNAGNSDSSVGREMPGAAPDSGGATNSKRGSVHSDDSEQFSVVVLRWAVQLADALAFAHTHNILHCDVKPGNVLLMPDLSVRLLDFNLAWSTDDTLRCAGGTLPYMASEQLAALYFSDTGCAGYADIQDSSKGSRNTEDAGISGHATSVDGVTIQTDVFGLCATIWHVVAGEPPFGVSVDEATRSDSAMVLQQRHRQGLDAAAVARVRGILPRAAADLLISGLNADPAKRPASAAEVACRLSRLLPDAVPQTLPKTRRLRKVGVTTGVTVMLILGIFMISVFRPQHLQRPDGALLIDQNPREASLGQPASGTPVADFHLETLVSVRRHLQQREFHASLQALARLESRTPETRFLELYSRSCLLAAPVLQPPESFYRIIGRADDLINVDTSFPWLGEHALSLKHQWLTLASEWQSLAEQEAFRAECWANLAFIHLELNNVEAMEQCFENACEAGLTAEQGRRLQVISEINQAHQDQRFHNTDLLQILKQHIAAAGTRGEAMVWLTAAVREIRHQAGVPVKQQHQQTLELSRIFEDPNFPVEPEAIWLVLQDRRIFGNKTLMKQILDASQTPRTSNRNRLVEVLLLPPESSLNSATMVASHR